jgi:hypothetical protein
VHIHAEGQFYYSILQTVKRNIDKIYINSMVEQENTISSSVLPTEGGQSSVDRLQMIDTLKAPIIEMGHNLGYEIVENYDLGAGPIHVCWIFKAGSESLPDMRLGFICMPEFTSESSLNEAIARAMINLIDKLVIVVPTEEMAAAISRSIENLTDPQRSILQLRKYTTVLTPSTLVSKSGIEGAKEQDSPQTGGEAV